jgi:hypothetical protein
VIQIQLLLIVGNEVMFGKLIKVEGRAVVANYSKSSYDSPEENGRIIIVDVLTTFKCIPTQ